MKKSLILVFVFSLLIYSNIYSQQDPQYTQYMYNMTVVNPAYAGSKEAISLGLLYRKQWVNLDGAPTTLTFSGHSPIAKNVGAGLSIISDKIGPVSETNAYADISYTVQMTEESKLAFGLKTGATFHKVDFSIINPTLVQANDALFSQNNPNITSMNFGLGLFYYGKKYYLSASMPNILNTKYLDYNGVSYGTEARHYFISGGYVFDLNESWKFKPSCLVKSAVKAPTSFDISANFLYNEKWEIGACYRREDSFSLMTNYVVAPNLRIGYAYDHIVSQLNVTTRSSHEFMILYDLYFSKKVYQSSRFY